MKLKSFQVLADCAGQFIQTLALEPLTTTALDNIVKLLPENSGLQLHLMGINGKRLYHKSHRGLPEEMIGIGGLAVGQGLAGRVAEKQQIMELGEEAIEKALPGASCPWINYLGLPLLHQDQIIGVLGCYLHEPLDDESHSLLSAISDILASALHNSLQHEQAGARARRFITLSRAITATRQLGTLDEVLEDLAKVLVQSFGFDLAWIGLMDSDEVLTGRVAYGQKSRSLDVHHRFDQKSDENHPAMEAARTGHSVIVPVLEDIENSTFLKSVEKAGIQSFGYVPILKDDSVIGVLGVFYLEDQPFDDEDAKTLTSVAEQAAIAIENAQLYELIRTSEANYRTLFQSAGTGLVILNESLEIMQANQAFVNLISAPDAESLVGASFVELLSANGESEPGFASSLAHPPQTWECAIFLNDQSVRQIHFNTTRIPSSQAIQVSLIDMTRERELERRLYRSEELASIGELSAGIAHEIRNPLVAITTSASLLQDEPELSEEGQQLIDVIKDESNHLAVIVDDFLRFARPKKPLLRDENINKLMDELMRRAQDISDKEVELVSDFEDDLPMIAIDRHQIQQVMTNLLLNGIHASEEGARIDIRTRRENSVDGPRIRIDVNDSGVGIPADEITKIFQPFFSTKERGTGLGLAICRRIIDGHDGEITVESVPDKGALFSVYLPIRFEHQLQQS